MDLKIKLFLFFLFKFCPELCLILYFQGILEAFGELALQFQFTPLEPPLLKGFSRTMRDRPTERSLNLTLVIESHEIKQTLRIPVEAMGI